MHILDRERYTCNVAKKQLILMLTCCAGRLSNSDALCARLWRCDTAISCSAAASRYAAYRRRSVCVALRTCPSFEWSALQRRGARHLQHLLRTRQHRTIALRAVAPMAAVLHKNQLPLSKYTEIQRSQSEFCEVFQRQCRVRQCMILHRVV